MSEEIFVGIDVCKAWLDSAQEPPASEQQQTRLSPRTAYDEQGCASLVEQIRQLRPALVVLEATGGFESQIVSLLCKAGIAVAVVNPKRVRDFARAATITAKTDKLDARVLALFGQRMRPKVSVLADDEQQEITELVDRRAQLVSMRAQEKARRATIKPVALKSVLEHIAWLDKRIAEIDKELDARLKDSPVYKARYEQLQSVPGLGAVSTAMLLARLPELGTLSGKRISALVGVAPFADDSGKRKGQRYVQGGRAAVRSGLFIAVVTARKYNPVIKAQYEHLRAAGKPYKVAMTACVHKLLLTINSMMKSGEMWLDMTTV